VGSGFLDIAQRDASAQRGSDEAWRSVCGPTVLVIPARRAIRRTIHPAPCRSSRRPSAARKMGPSLRSPMARSIARAVRGASGPVTTLPPLRVITRVRWPLDTQRFDVRASGLGDPQPIQRKQRDRRVLRRRAKSGGDQQGADLVAVQPGGVRLVIQPRPPSRAKNSISARRAANRWSWCCWHQLANCRRSSS
jgi:hypothetical protein